jgi:hypothetical protein
MRFLSDGSSCSRKPVGRIATLSTEARRDATGWEFIVAFSPNPKVLAYARRWGALKAQTARKSKLRTCIGVRHLR